jgi:CheY-like chemotaxis protein/anti-sigma regulatory factor (Ser/Thr protein kinase)
MPTVLVVDDSLVDRRLVGGILAHSPDLQVEFASDGEEALERIEVLAPHLVVTDLVMPGISGLELVSAIRQRFAHLPVILMTAKGSEDVALQALRAGAASYVPKAQISTLLRETVSTVLSAVIEKRGQQQLMSLIEQASVSFIMGNDAALIPPFIAYVQDLTSQVGLCEAGDSVRVAIALEEALRNAMFHGNLEISSELREGDSATYRRVLHNRLESEPYCSRKLYLQIAVSKEMGEFVIRDEGPGFDPSTLPDPTDPENIEKACGRGLLLMRTFMDGVDYNRTGNQVTLTKRANHVRA